MNFSSRNKTKAEWGMSSMTDLVFLLLIFFIIMSLMANNQTPVKLPKPSTEIPQNQDPIAVTIVITENNLYYILPGETEKDARSFEQIKELVYMKVTESAEPKLRIAGHHDAKYASIFEVLALTQANGWDPILAYEK
jgi:biopolymer transport protein ExbD